ncbi:hypothetical protein G6F57_021119 [Rhizopus arrhizus]|nr:hypothetical protein G6F57_021119 [Rhizopus arrhizus]
MPEDGVHGFQAVACKGPPYKLGRNVMPKTDAGAARRILLVEDHPVERAYLQNMLLAWGYRRVAGVGSSTEAVGALGRQFYDLVISDIVMGDGDGTHLPNELRRLVDPERRAAAVPCAAGAASGLSVGAGPVQARIAHVHAAGDQDGAAVRR